MNNLFSSVSFMKDPIIHGKILCRVCMRVRHVNISLSLMFDIKCCQGKHHHYKGFGKKRSNKLLSCSIH
jgi:hypothetical protein